MNSGRLERRIDMRGRTKGLWYAGIALAVVVAYAAISGAQEREPELADTRLDVLTRFIDNYPRAIARRILPEPEGLGLTMPQMRVFCRDGIKTEQSARLTQKIREMVDDTGIEITGTISVDGEVIWTSGE